MPPILALHTRERRQLFGYLLLSTLLLTAAAGSLVRYIRNEAPSNAAAISQQIHRQQLNLKRQNEYLPDLEELNRQVTSYNPHVMASFVNADIEHQLVITRRVFGADALTFFQAFDQTANFYQMMFHDKQVLAKVQENAQYFDRELKKCQGAVSLPAAPPGTVSPVLPAATLTPLTAR